MVTEQRSHLCSTTRMLDESSEKDLHDEDRLFIKKVRQYLDVLFGEEVDSFDIYQKRLQKMYNLGILNLIFTPIDEKDKLHRAIASKRSLVCHLRATNKKPKQVTTRVKKAEEKYTKIKNLLKVAEAQVAVFRVDHPDWTPPEKLLLAKDQQEEVVDQVLDKEVVDVEKQMEIDPTGMLTLFWQ